MSMPFVILQAVCDEKWTTAREAEGKRKKLDAMRAVARAYDIDIINRYLRIGDPETTAKYFGLEPQTVRDLLVRRGYIPRVRLTSKS